MVVRVRGVEDARRLRDELRDDQVGARVVPPGVAAPTGAGTADVVADGGDRIELDPEAFAGAVSDLERLHEVVADLLERAGRESEQPLGDGKGPVSLNMRRAFGVRGGDVGGGVRAALRSYLEELGTLREALQQVSATHQAEDEDMARTMGRL
ncbi:hypothetical protein [Umezawaea sp. Da 62-37]|uniref:hypothetical protein n=1 Tax=Umezawaea sp. Da 62-37 TaxID=3075927 RepID=UPI0028F71A2F|nr:hypothetical protein [Umezawaea sp. Da 62-37]WNV85868.1 hypothetical protein RM788_48445 [Umezawaea sp. Da 62-37]